MRMTSSSTPSGSSKARISNHRPTSSHGSSYAPSSTTETAPSTPSQHFRLASAASPLLTAPTPPIDIAPPQENILSESHIAQAAASKSQEDRWDFWTSTVESEQGGALAFRSRQLMGMGDRSSATKAAFPPPSSTSTVKLPRPAPISPQKRSKASGPIPPQVQRAKPAIPANSNLRKGAVIMEPPAANTIPLAKAKKLVIVPKSTEPPRTPPNLFKAQLPADKNGTYPHSPHSVQSSESSTGFPPGCLLDQIANSAIAWSRMPDHTSSALDTAGLASGRIEQALEKVRTSCVHHCIEDEASRKLRRNVATQTPQDMTPSHIDLLSCSHTQEVSGSSKQPITVTLALADELAGLSFDSGDNGASPLHPTSHSNDIGSYSATQTSFMDERGGCTHDALLDLGLNSRDDFVMDTTPCLIIDQDGGSDGGSPITPLQPLRALSFFSPPKATADPPVAKNTQSVAPTISLSIDRQIQMENAVKAFGYPPDISTRLLELLKTLPRKEQAVCLFNEAVLKEKLAKALQVIAAEDESEEEEEL